MIVTTTPSIEGRSSKDFNGVTVGEAIIGVNNFRDVFAHISDIVGGQSGAYEQSLAEAKSAALSGLEERAVAVGGDAVVSVDLDYADILSQRRSGCIELI